MKKTLSLLLAALMLLVCIPVYASAQTITLAVENVELEPPTPNPSTINYGTTLGEVALEGGKVWYVDPDTNQKIQVEGTYTWLSTTRKPAVSAAHQESSLRFIPTDTETYGAGFPIALSRAVIVSGEWPTIVVKGIETELVEKPGDGTLTAGKMLSSASITGGKVIDKATQEDITSKGRWRVQNGGYYPTEAGTIETEVKWTATGYEPVSATVNVVVTGETATIVTPPDWAVDVAVNMAFAVKSGGKVIDSAGNDITSSGKFSYIGTETLYSKSTEIDIRWLCTGYFPIEAKAPLTVTSPKVSLYYEPEVLVVNPGTTYKKAIESIKIPGVYMQGVSTTRTQLDMALTYWTFPAPEGITDDTVLTEDLTLIGTYQREGIDTVLTYTQVIDVLKAPAAVISEVPTVNTEGIIPGMKADSLVLEGGSADCEGVFTLSNPDQVLVAGSNILDLTFTPNDLIANDPAYTTITVVVKGIFVFLDADGKETVPVYTIPYGTNLRDSNMNMGTILAQTGCSLNCTENYGYYPADDDSYIFGTSFHGITPAVGTHTMEVLVKSYAKNIYSEPLYEDKVLTYIIVVEPVEMGIKSVVALSNGTEIKIVCDTPIAKGTFDVYVDNKLIGDDVVMNSIGEMTIPWTAPADVNADYSIKIVYNPVENDSCSMTDYEGTFRTNLMMSVAKDSMFSLKVNGMEISGAVSDMVSEGSRITCSVPYLQQADFISWYIVDENGNPIDVEVYGIEKKRDQFGAFIETKVEATLTDYEINFDMPNGNVRVYYKTQAMLDAEIMQEAIDNCDCICHHNNPVSQFIWKIISFFMDLFGITKDCSCGYPHGAK